MSNPVKISAAQIAQYHRDGAVLLKSFLTSEERDLLEQGLEESYANPSKRFAKVRSPEGEGETFLETFPSLNAPSLRKLLSVGRIPEVAGRAMKCPSAQLILDQAFYKKAGFVNPTPWHQDTPFLRVRGYDMARIWLTCDVSPKALTIQMVRGSHRWNVVYSGNPPDTSRVANSNEGKMFAHKGTEGDAAPQPPDVARYRDSFDILTWDVEPGDALVFNGNMIHGADGVDNSPTPRRAFTSMWGGPDLRYIVPEGNAIPTLADINGYKIPHGARIGDYKDAFPVGWEETPGENAA